MGTTQSEQNESALPLHCRHSSRHRFLTFSAKLRGQEVAENIVRLLQCSSCTASRRRCDDETLYDHPDTGCPAGDQHRRGARPKSLSGTSCWSRATAV